MLVTGASSGIGEATARLLAERGAALAVAGRDGEALAKVAADTGGSAIPGDLTAPGVARATVAAAAAELGGLDLLVSNAGAGWAGPFADMSPAAIDALLDVNLRAAGHLVSAALPHLRRRPGRVVLVGSIAGLLDLPGEAWYSATKAGLAGFARALREELRPEGITVNLVVPGVVATRFFERRNRPYDRSRPRPLAPERVAACLVAAIERDTAVALVPGWLTVPARLHAALPGLYRTLAGRLS
ncbi:MAG TPA: SDR family oxidoreductase [Acidimicrobiales bacterium]|nr:SDR family oxidoreductase [Acidimicrobiales bacterium]